MIKLIKGNILDSKCQYLINPINCVGVMGKGLALAFKHAYPSMYSDYVDACRNKCIRVGEIWIWNNILCFPTKNHYKHSSDYRWIVDGLKDLDRLIHYFSIESIAIPALGCGEGGLKWESVLKYITESHKRNAHVYYEIYEPLE